MALTNITQLPIGTTSPPQANMERRSEAAAPRRWEPGSWVPRRRCGSCCAGAHPCTGRRGRGHAASRGRPTSSPCVARRRRGEHAASKSGRSRRLELRTCGVPDGRRRLVAAPGEFDYVLRSC
jgi:hypothetical protein